MVGAGADELIDLIMRAILNPGDAIINCPPTFGMYKFDAAVNNASVISILRKPNFEINIGEITEAVGHYKPKALFLANPNNPDGSTLTTEAIDQLLTLPTMIVMDEAYVDFAEIGTSLISRLELLSKDNLIILRTFSKWAGLAGLRVGFGIFPDWLIPHLWKIKQPYNVSVAASSAAIYSLENVDQLENVTHQIIKERERLLRELEKIPWLSPYTSQANFILCKIIGKDAGMIKAELARKGILVRYFKVPGLVDHIRISVGLPSHTDRLIETLGSLDG
jgi:histidinol-phosphate aminotransferase